MPPKKTSTRLDITLPISLVDRLRAHTEEQGITISSFIGQAVRSHLDGGGPAPSPSPGQMTLSPADIDSLISQRVEEALRAHMSKLPVAPVSIPSDVPSMAVTPGQVTLGEVGNPAPVIIKKEPVVPVGKVTVPVDIREKMTHYTASTIEKAILATSNPDHNPEIKTIARGTLQGFVKGTSSITSPEYCEQIIKAVEYLESSGN